MPLKSFKELYSLDISKEIKKKPTFKREKGGTLITLPKDKWLDYLEWATVLVLLYDNGADKVTYYCDRNENNYPAFFKDNSKPFVRVHVIIDDREYIQDYPVIDGNKVDDSPNQLIIHKAQQRAFVKCIAVNTGLGLKLWQKEEHSFDDLGNIDTTNPNNLPELLPGTEKWVEAIKALKNGYTIIQIRKKYYITNENEEKLLNESIQD